MKILCLLVFLANIILALWEYRNGGFTAQTHNTEQQAISGREQILLSKELNPKTQSSLSKPKNEISLVESKTGIENRAIQPSHKATSPINNSQADYPQALLP